MATIEGVGIGLRARHFQTILNQRPAVPWFEVVADQFLYSDGPHIEKLKQISEHYPIVLHCLGSSVGSDDAINYDYLQAVRKLADSVNALWVSDHCAWVSFNGQYLFDLLPLPYNETTLKHVAKRAAAIQDYLGKPLALENISSYITLKNSSLNEAVFLHKLAELADIKLLIDINNIFVNSQNQDEPAQHFFQYIDPEHICQLHLAGYEQKNTWLIDSHSQPIQAPVWQLYQQALSVYGPIPTSIEWDNYIPSWTTLIAEQKKAQHYLNCTHPAIKSEKNITTISPKVCSTSQLNEVQLAWIEALQHNQTAKLLSHCKHPEIEAKKRIEIYQASRRNLIMAAFFRVYQASIRLVGKIYLTHLIDAYLKEAKFTSPDITAGAAGLCHFTKEHPPTIKMVPYLADFLTFEWLWYQTFHNRKSKQLNNQLESQYPLAEIWQMCQPEYQGKITWPTHCDGHYLFRFILKKNQVVIYEQHKEIMS